MITISYGQGDPTAKPDSRPQTAHNQPFADISDLQYDGRVPLNVQTGEWNQGILDGAQVHLPDDASAHSWGLWSAQLSGDDGVFVDPPVLDVLFSHPHKSPGLTFYFYSDGNAALVDVAWCAGDGRVLKSGIYPLSGREAYLGESVNGFQRIKISFLKTEFRERYVKLIAIDYGRGRAFRDDEIDAVEIIERLDPISYSVAMNTLNFTVKTHSTEFSIVSGVGDNMLMTNQQMRVTVDGRDFGAFFLRPTQEDSEDGATYAFAAVDAVGVMDMYPFRGGIYNREPLESILSQLFRICFPTQLIRYVIDGELAGVRISGWIPKCTCREALQLACFAAGAVADDSRRDYVWIYRRDTSPAPGVQDVRIYASPKPRLRPTTYFSGVDLTAYQYLPGGEIKEEHNAVLPVGRRTIEFSEPLHDLQISGGAAIVESSANYAIVDVAAEGPVVVSGNRYVVNKTIFSMRAPDVSAGEVENVWPFDKCTLISPEDAPALAEYLFDYLRQRAEFDGEAVLGDLEVGFVVPVPTYNHNFNTYPIVGTIEQLEINARGGRARMKVIGNVDTSGNR